MENSLTHQFKPLPRSSPEQEFVSPIHVAAFEHALKCSKAIPRGYMLLRDGKVVAERFWQPYTPENKVWVYSLSKSFTATAIGLAVDSGLLSTSDRVVDFFKDKAPADIGRNLGEMRVQHLLNMTTGHATEPIPPLEKAMQLDWTEYFLHAPIEHAPGEHFLYNSMASFMLSAILHKVSGISLHDYLRIHLFEPLGFDETFWDAIPQGINTGGWGLMVRLEDAAKLGQLYLDGGSYQGKRILSETWVQAATSFQSDTLRPNEPVDWCQGYGYQFWLCRHDAYRGDGAFGQFCVVMPKQKMVLALMCETFDMQSVLDIVWEHVLPAVDSPTHTKEVEVDGNCYAANNSPSGVEKIQFFFEKEFLRVVLTHNERETQLRCGRVSWTAGEIDPSVGLGTLWKMSTVPFIALRGQTIKTSAWFEWKDEETLRINVAFLETPHRNCFEIHFNKTGITLHMLPPSFEQGTNPVSAVFSLEESKG